MNVTALCPYLHPGFPHCWHLGLDHFRCGDCPVWCGKFSSLPGLYPAATSNKSSRVCVCVCVCVCMCVCVCTRTCNNQKCLWTLPNVTSQGHSPTHQHIHSPHHSPPPGTLRSRTPPSPLLPQWRIAGLIFPHSFCIKITALLLTGLRWWKYRTTTIELFGHHFIVAEVGRTVTGPNQKKASSHSFKQIPQNTEKRRVSRGHRKNHQTVSKATRILGRLPLASFS